MIDNIVTFPGNFRFGVRITVDYQPALEDGFYTGSNVTITPFINNGPSDNTASNVRLLVTTRDGTVVVDETSVASSPTVSTFEVSDIGYHDYEIVYTEDDLDTSYKVSGTIETEDNISLAEDTCGAYKISNYSDIDYSYTYNDGTSDIVGDIVSNGYITPEFVEGITEVKIWKKITETSADARTYLVNNFCAIEECMARFIEDLICKTRDNCDLCPDDVEAVQMHFYYHTYFMKVHQLFYKNSYFEAGDDTFLPEVQSIKYIASKIQEYCEFFHGDQCETCF